MNRFLSMASGLLLSGCAAGVGTGGSAGPGDSDPADGSPDDTGSGGVGDNDEICDGIDNDGDGVVDEGLEFAHYWRDVDGDGFGGPTGSNCADLLEQGVGSGVHEIWPTGREEAPLTVFCDQETDGGGWARVFHHDVAGGYFSGYEQAFHHNESDPDAELYSILEHLERLRSPDGTLELRINWPGTGITGRNIWRQRSNPTTAPVAGYEPIDINHAEAHWGGLELSTSGATYLDGSVQHPYWFYAIGSFTPWNEGIPAYGPAATRVALWVRTAPVGGAEVVWDCEAPSGYAGAPGDCDDRDADVSPDAQEVCNGKDDDCDGQTDIGCPYGDIDLQVGPGPLQFYPRDLVSDTCAFTLEGTGRGAAEEVRIVVTRDGVLHSEASAASDAFAIDVTLDAGLHRYDLAVSWDAGSGHWTESQTIEDIVCGDVFLIDGQSNAVASDYHGERLGDLERNPFVRSFGSATTDASVIHDDAFGIAVANTPHVHASIGQWGIRMANRLSAEAEIPILVINGAVGGTSVWQHQRNGADPTDVNTIYGRMLWRAQRAGVADAVRAMVWHQGEADGGTAYGDYLEAWAAMHDGWQTDYPNLEGAYVLQPRAGCGGPTWNRNVHRDLPDLVDGVIGHMSTTGVDGHDGCHFYNSSYVEWGERMARLIQRDLYGASLDDDIEAPDPVSAVWTSPTALEIDFGDTGNGLVLQAGAEAYFRLSDGAVVDRARVEDSRVVLTTASPSSAAWVSFVDESGDIPWLVNARGIGSFAWYELAITP